MKPYYDTHSAGVLLLIVLLAWLSMEAIQFVRQWQWRAGATKIGRRSFWLGFGACLIVTNLALYLGPSVFPAATIRPGAVAFAVGMVIMVTGVVLRGWSFHALGQYFTAVIKVSPDQPVVTNGPYRLLRHPSYAGGLLAEVHAEIIDVDIAAAQALPGVVAIITGKDCDKTFGVLPVARTEHPLARERVRYRGEPVAAVAAVDDATAAKALKLITMTVRELPAYYTAREAMAPGAVNIHDHRPGNIERNVDFELGDVAAGLRRGGSRARKELSLRRGLPEPDGDARRARRIRPVARTHDRPCQHAGALLRASHAVADPRHGDVADPRGEAACRRRLRLPHRDAQCRADRGAAGAQGGRRPRAHRGQSRRDLHHPSRPARD